MVTRTIYAHALTNPDRMAVVYNHTPISYGRFARLVDITRLFLQSLDLPRDRVAVLLVDHLLDAWIIGLAARALGVDTVIARGVDDIARLDLPNLGVVLATQMEAWTGSEAACDASGWPLARVPAAIYAGAAQAGAPSMPEFPDRQGGHILLTSGTTGRYKKVLIEARHEAALHARRQAVFGIGADSVVNLFDFGGWAGAGYKCAIGAWDAGGCVSILQRKPRHTAFAVPGLTHAFAVPQMLGEVFEAPPGAFPRLETMGLYVTGGPLTQAMADEVVARLTPRLFTHIGATETSTFTFTPVREPEDRRRHRIIPGCVVEVVDDAGVVLPLGAEGRVRVGVGDGVTGYLDDAETSETFFREGYFYPGDLGTIDGEGRLMLLGRITDVINIQGHKVAAGPIEDALRESLSVSGACIFSLPNAEGEEEIHIALETDRTLDPARLSEAISAQLTGFDSAQVHVMPALPRNHMGKIERLELRARLLGGA